jgi:hypothetical protein
VVSSIRITVVLAAVTLGALGCGSEGLDPDTEPTESVPSAPATDTRTVDPPTSGNLAEP